MKSQHKIGRVNRHLVSASLKIQMFEQTCVKTWPWMLAIIFKLTPMTNIFISGTTTISVTTLAIKALFGTSSIMAISITTFCRYAECHYDDCHGALLALVWQRCLMFHVLNNWRPRTGNGRQSCRKKKSERVCSTEIEAGPGSININITLTLHKLHWDHRKWVLMAQVPMLL